MALVDSTELETAHTGETPAEDQPEDLELIQKFRAGDPEAVGLFLQRHGALVRAHYRRKIGRSMQRLVDSQDLLSTIARRLCQRVQGGGVRAEDQRQFWALVFRIGDGALVDRVRIVSRLRSLEAADSPFVQSLRACLDRPQGMIDEEFAEELSRMLDCLSSSTDRQLLTAWLNGQTFAEAGNELGLTPAATRKRWQRMRQSIRDYWTTRDLI